jgi:hypothetical protein
MGLVTLTASSCELAPDPGGRDAGVASEQVSDRAGVSWRLADEPEFSISESGASEPVFQVFRASSGVITGSNQIVIANTGSNNLIYLVALRAR